MFNKKYKYRLYKMFLISVTCFAIYSMENPHKKNMIPKIIPSLKEMLASRLISIQTLNADDLKDLPEDLKEYIHDLKRFQLLQEELNKNTHPYQVINPPYTFYTDKEKQIIKNLMANSEHIYKPRLLNKILQKAIFAQHEQIIQLLKSAGARIHPYYPKLIENEPHQGKMFLDFIITAMFELAFYSKRPVGRNQVFAMGSKPLKLLLQHTNIIPKDAKVPILIYVMQHLFPDERNSLNWQYNLLSINNRNTLSKEIMELLINAKLEDINKKDKNGNTALHHAIRKYKSVCRSLRLESVEKQEYKELALYIILSLLQNEADIYVKNNKEQNALDLANILKLPHIVEILKEIKNESGKL